MTEIPIRDYFEARIEAIVKDYETRISAVETATKIALQANEKRLELLNELRNVVTDMHGSFVQVVVFNFLREKYDADMAKINGFISEQKGKASQSSLNVTTIMSVMGLLVGAINLLREFVK